MIYIRFDKDNKAEFILYQYIDGVSEVDLTKGLLFDEIPQAEELEDKVAILKLNSSDQTLYYEYEDVIHSEERMLLEEVKALQEEIKTRDVILEQLENDIADLTLEIALGGM